MRISLHSLSMLVIALLAGCASYQRELLYYPTHRNSENGLSQWSYQNQLIGYCHTVQAPKNVWLMLHGNGGQASDRVYALSSFSAQDSVFILEYPGYGAREGFPSMGSFNSAAKQAYEILRASFPDTPICVIGESIGSGPACILATVPNPPDKIILVVPFDILSSVASDHFPFLPTSLILCDNWNNIEALRDYKGALEIYGAKDDTVIPVKYAKALAESKPKSIYHEIEGGHNDWSRSSRVKIQNP